MKQEDDQELNDSFLAAAASEQQDAACNTMAVVIKEESDELSGKLCHMASASLLAGTFCLSMVMFKCLSGFLVVLVAPDYII